MRIFVVDDYAALSRMAADIVMETLAARPDAAMTLATGSTPMGAYRELAARCADLSQARVFQLDAYLGLAEEDRRSLYGWLKRSFLDPLRVTDGNVVRLPGACPDPEQACARYAEAVHQVGGYDLALLGLGPNGHVGFNEPPSRPQDATRRVVLSIASLHSNARYWGGLEFVPREALTAGMDVLMAARRIVLLVSGASKREILRRTIHGTPCADVPASWLQQAADFTVIADRAAWIDT